MRDSDVGKVGIDDLYDLIIIVGEFLKLEVKVVQPCDKLHLRGVASDDYELFAEDAFDDKTASVMLQSGLAKQLVEADIQLFIEPERVFITRCSGLPVGYVCRLCLSVMSVSFRSVSIISVKKAFDWGERPGPAERVPLSDKGTARCCLATTKIRAEELLPKVSEVLLDGS